MSSSIYPDKIIHFPNSLLPIEINYKNTLTFKKCRTFDPKLIGHPKVWHQIRVCHNGKNFGTNRIQDILDAIFFAIDGAEMFPVAYRQGEREDCFLVRNCQAALEKLFALELRVQMINASFVNLLVEFNVANYKIGQISPTTNIAQALNNLYNCMESVNGVHGILNLMEFDKNAEFFDVIVHLGNRAVLNYVCDAIYRNDEKFRTLNGINFSRNRITTLAPLQVFQGTEFYMLDLSNNELSSNRICRELRHVKAELLLLAGNPITKTSEYPECLKPILKNFKFVDGIPSENLSKEYTPMNHELDLECDGYRIDWSNKDDIDKFGKSDNWHAILIPDADEEYTKEFLFNYFFLSVSNEFSELFPCYYKFFNNEHRFLVRECFDQLKHLVENCNLEIKIPRLITPPSSPRDNDPTPRTTTDKVLVYYMRMDVGTFKAGQIEPLVAIRKALECRFSAMDRLLNLENFQTAEGLENVVVNLTSTKVLSRILTLASRKFLSTCVEMHLGQNKIVTINFPKSMHMMNNLKAIDLANNWIQDLKSITDLQVLGLKSLRLDGNPLCSQYSSAGEYIKAVRHLFPDLTKLDNMEVKAKGNLCTQKNFLCNVCGYDFVQDFVPKYFQLYESDNRALLSEFYHPRAMLTLTFNFKIANMTPNFYKRIFEYKKFARNIYKMNKFSRTSSTVIMGATDIITSLMDLPSVTHDIVSFSTDTTIFDENMVAITVHGLFMDQETLESDILMAFTRTFLLIPYETNLGVLKCGTSYKIINDQYNIFNPTPLQNKQSFRLSKNDQKKLMADLTVEDKEALLVMFKSVTSLTAIWCTRCLEEGEWDFKKALERFMILIDRKEIPETAFV